jgi:SOS-response transcriptional repressor LexA
MACRRHAREEAILHFLAAVGERHAPSLDELASQVDAAKTTIRDDLLRLLDTGDVETAAPPGRYQPTRGYRLSRQGAARIGTSSMRVVGVVAAGEPAIAIDPFPTTSRTLKDVLGLGPDDYIIPVRGWSMDELGVRPGDLLIVHPQLPEQIREGEVVVAVVHETADVVGLTLKRWHREPGGRVRLQPAHLDLGDDPDDKQYQPLRHDGREVEVCGKLLGVICPTDATRTRLGRL